MRIKTAISTAAFALTMSLPAFAQDDMPALLRGIEGIESAGVSDGLELFTAEGAHLLIGRAEGQNDIFIGMVFDGDGRDIAAMILGTEEVTFDDVLEAAGGSRAQPSQEMSGVLEDSAEQLLQELQDADSQEEFVEILRAWQEKVRGGPAPTSEQAPAETAEPSREVSEAPADVTTDIASLLTQGATSSEPAQGETEPRRDLQQILRNLQDVQPVDPSVIPQAPAETSADEPGSVGDENLDNLLDEVMGEASAVLENDGQEAVIYDVMVNEAFRFTVGDVTAPIVYAFIDPACIYCSRALEAIRPMVEAGQIRISVIPVPAISPESPNAVARIVSAENPARALFDNARFALSGGTDPLQNVRFDDLDDEMKDHIVFNTRRMHDLGINNVPFFSFMTEDGPRVFAGLPRQDTFNAALPEE